MNERASGVSYLMGGVLRALLVLLTTCFTAEGGDCPKSCTCHVPNEVHCTFRYLITVPENIQPSVEKLNMGYNSIAMIKENDLIGLKHLELLMLHSNTILDIEDGAFKDLPSLQVLKMSYNKLEKIDKETFAVKSIHLSDNLLSSLPADIFPSSIQLDNLFLHGNPWSCDCRMAWFQKWRTRNVGVLKCKRDRRGQLCPPEIKLQLDRTPTTFSTLHVKYQSVVRLRLDNRPTNRDGYSWTMIKHDNETKTQHTALTGGVAQFSCAVVGYSKQEGQFYSPIYHSSDYRVSV
uniref:Uncharacterized protein n=1 Tax=Knipowitschia caucasica TaxID=637954 RepID=A0AAV2IZW2_KNICA